MQYICECGCWYPEQEQLDQCSKTNHGYKLDWFQRFSKVKQYMQQNTGDSGNLWQKFKADNPQFADW